MAREILAEFPAGGPRGSWPAEERAEELRQQGQAAEVVLRLDDDRFLVVVPGGEQR